MGRHKQYDRRFLIGLDKFQAKDLERLSKVLGYSYSEVISAALEYYCSNLQ